MRYSVAPLGLGFPPLFSDTASGPSSLWKKRKAYKAAETEAARRTKQKDVLKKKKAKKQWFYIYKANAIYCLYFIKLMQMQFDPFGFLPPFPYFAPLSFLGYEAYYFSLFWNFFFFIKAVTDCTLPSAVILGFCSSYFRCRNCVLIIFY